MKMQKRGKDGKFIRIRKKWNPYKNYNDRYIDNKGRFRVYLPNCPYQLNEGYVLRSYAMLWYNNIKIPKGYDVHHKDENKLNDKLFNLIILKHFFHSKLHNEKRIKD